MIMLPSVSEGDHGVRVVERLGPAAFVLPQVPAGAAGACQWPGVKLTESRFPRRAANGILPTGAWASQKDQTIHWFDAIAV